MQIVSIAIQKGGSGKTTTAINLAAALKQLGKSVLLIDLDPQANLTQALGYNEPEPNIYHAFKEEFRDEESDLTKITLESSGLAFVPASLELAQIELELIGVFSKEKILSLMLQSVGDAYDYVFIDCPPAVGMLTVNALTASHYVLMPLQAEFLPLKGVQSFKRSFEQIKRKLNPSLEILGIVLTKYNARKSTNKKISTQLMEEYGELVFDTKIRTNISLAKSQEWGVDIFSYDRSANGAYDYMQLADEFLKKINKQTS